MCSTKSLLAGDGEIIAQIYKERVARRGYGSGAGLADSLRRDDCDLIGRNSRAAGQKEGFGRSVLHAHQCPLWVFDRSFGDVGAMSALASRICREVREVPKPTVSNRSNNEATRSPRRRAPAASGGFRGRAPSRSSG